MKLTTYDVDDNVVRYKPLDLLFGPKVTQDDLLALETRAVVDGWEEWFYIIQGYQNKRKRRWLLALIRDNVISVSVRTIVVDPSYDDDDPWELDR